MADPSNADAARTCYGRRNPERIENPFWETAVRENLSGWGLAQRLGLEHDFGQKFDVSAYRRAARPPVFSWQRFGRTSTPLPDGRIVHIGGVHEDYYDPDFCIYNDVTVEHPGGRPDFYIYPPDAFPPTDFHTATLLGESIWIIGSVGYQDLRGDLVQVLRLDLESFEIARVETRGERPGWLYKHRAEALDDNRILILGGMFLAGSESRRNEKLLELDTEASVWRLRDHDDRTLFPVSADVYAACKSPRFGRANPEKIDNPFWLEMARRNWLPSRARLHYGDFGEPEPKQDNSRSVDFGSPLDAEALKKIVADFRATRPAPGRPGVVWTARRVDAAEVTFADGTRLRIGGEVVEFRDGFHEEWPDVWTYADVIVERPDGEIEICAYPPDIMPPFFRHCAVARPDFILVFGDADFPEGPGYRSLVLRIDARTLQITILDQGGAPPRVLPLAESLRVVGDRAFFELLRDTADQPILYAVFDLAALCWVDEIVTASALPPG